ncbi:MULTISPECIES: hypothetical protein [unclassified Bradyrhizobium]|uniref:hypothetical protein n=1 Tax=unclassified Bradyrhizobium TaxID=2631580 RepID=UPI00247AAF39|nr:MULTISPECIES: hypothetical protein [unclassified Bradyrhizobium]WGR74345.1 hypothetical protein MTX24_16605 [Bradyrhizobium sp. ISRA426]WGR79180.1 hypothetical protein MTX21_01720 [Bradyrhizobium sp. ISRA430]WGR90601.1 hypothetical protein MTX25_39865 [Bradyrhizobium sp. ISRA432]
MGSAGMAAGGTSLASVGLSAYADLLKGQSTATADEYQAARLDNAAVYGELKAKQTSGQMSRSLNTTLGNIEAVRAAAKADPLSPTGQAVLQNQEDIGDEQRGIVVNSILQQARQDRSDAAYYRDAAGNALTMGYVSAGADVLKGVTPLFKGL